MSNEMIWAFGLSITAVFLFLIEIMLPSAGVLGFASFAAVVASIVFFFLVDEWWGLASIGIYMVMMPTAIYFGLKILPYTPVGRRMILGSPDEEEELSRARFERERAEREQAEALIGAEGEAASDLRPVGNVTIEGTRIEALAEGAMIPKGARVRVMQVEGSRVRVRRID